MNNRSFPYHYILFPILSFILAACGNNESKKQVNITDTVAKTDSTAKNSAKVKNILFFGTSLTAGLGVDPDQAYPALIQEKLDSLKLPYKVINAGLSGETSADGKSRINWLLRQPVDIFVLELGANDGLRGIDVKQTEGNLQSIIDQVKKKYPNAKLVIAGMQMPPSMGSKYTIPFKSLFPSLAENNHMALIPFLLQGVGGVPALIQEDGLHPTAKGHHVLAENVWSVLKNQIDSSSPSKK